MHQYETYIFDLDGTLLSTLNDLAASTNYALRTHHMPERTLDEVRQFVGNGVKKLMERAYLEELTIPTSTTHMPPFDSTICSTTSTPQNPTLALWRCCNSCTTKAKTWPW